MLWGFYMFKKIVQIDFTNVTSYCMNQRLLNAYEILIFKIDLSIDKDLEEYLLLAKIAKQKEILPLFVVINGSKSSAKELEKLQNESYFEAANDAQFKTLYKEIVGTVTARGEGDINLDIADLKTILAHNGPAFFGTAQKCTYNAAHISVEEAIKNATIKNHLLSDMQGIMVYFSIHPDYEIMQLSHAMEIFYEHTHYDAEIIWGTTTNSSLGKEYVKAVIILTGCKSQSIAINNLKYKT